jgi:2-oxoacid:acceptor oxidoreductase gamma subunit (pyruvate/2-ketoisovalerate family)
MAERPVRLRCRVQTPDYVLVQDPALVELVDVTRGLKAGGLLLINGDEVPASLAMRGESFRVLAVPATRVALEQTGRPLTNTAMLGAFARVTGELSLESVLAAVRERFSGQLREINERAVEAGYRAAEGEGGRR